MKKKKTIKLRVHKSGSSYSYIVTIPKDLVELALKWEKGEKLLVEERVINGVRGVFISKAQKS